MSDMKLLIDKLESHLKNKRPYGVFTLHHYNPEYQFPLADFEDDEISIEFRATDDEGILDVRFFNPHNPDDNKMVAYSWDITKGCYDLYIEYDITNSASIMESIRYLNSNSLDFVMRLE